MIPFDFIYCKPSTLKEAHGAYVQLQGEGKSPVYYSGGSEVITMCRAGSIQPGAVIDLKEIPECLPLFIDNNGLTIGASCTLNQIKESKLFPLMALACGRIADHTNQCRITLGGNLCGTIIYRETSLPLLLSDAQITLFGGSGLRSIAFESVFSGRMQLDSGEFIVQVHVPDWALGAQHFHVKRTANEKIDYPLVSMAALRQGKGLRFAFSGLCSQPFRSKDMEAVLNNLALPCHRRVEMAANLLPQSPHSDVEASGEYRLFVFKNMMKAFLEDLSDDQV
jgi:xanthine dehydrogenase FAD-binding subunit